MAVLTGPLRHADTCIDCAHRNLSEDEQNVYTVASESVRHSIALGATDNPSRVVWR